MSAVTLNPAGLAYLAFTYLIVMVAFYWLGRWEERRRRWTVSTAGRRSGRRSGYHPVDKA